MESYVLNDVEYDFKPLEVFVPDPDYKVDEKELKKSIEKIRRLLQGQGRAEKDIYRTHDVKTDAAEPFAVIIVIQSIGEYNINKQLSSERVAASETVSSFV